MTAMKHLSISMEGKAGLKEIRKETGRTLGRLVGGSSRVCLMMKVIVVVVS